MFAFLEISILSSRMSTIESSHLKSGSMKANESSQFGLSYQPIINVAGATFALAVSVCRFEIRLVISHLTRRCVIKLRVTKVNRMKSLRTTRKFRFALKSFPATCCAFRFSLSANVFVFRLKVSQMQRLIHSYKLRTFVVCYVSTCSTLWRSKTRNETALDFASHRIGKHRHSRNVCHFQLVLFFSRSAVFNLQHLAMMLQRSHRLMGVPRCFALLVLLGSI